MPGVWRDRGLPACNPFLASIAISTSRSQKWTKPSLVGLQWKHAAFVCISKRLHDQQADATGEDDEHVSKFSEYEKFFFVYQMDFRGRKYVTSSFLSPQGPDYARAKLEFGDGKPLGDRGRYWLAVHGANVFGYDKVSFDDRVAWVEENEESILAYARDPFQAREWTEADKPWCFLAFCHEWKRTVVDGGVSYLPVSLDGSNNGLQHLSAMLRDTRGVWQRTCVTQMCRRTSTKMWLDVVIEMLKREDTRWLVSGWTLVSTARQPSGL